MFELVLGMCVILLVFIAMCAVEKIPCVDKMLEKGVEIMTAGTDGREAEAVGVIKEFSKKVGDVFGA